MINFDNVPQELRNLPQWVLWKYEIDKDGKKTKILKRANNPKVNASSTKSSTWDTFNRAMISYKANQVDGIGFVTTAEDGIVGIDLDVKGDEQMEKESQEIIAKMDSYTEVSPSGDGYHIFLLGQKNTTKCRRGGVECYEHSRFFTITGNVVGQNTKINPRQEQLDEFTEKYLFQATREAQAPITPTPVSFNDEEILRLMFSAANGVRVESLYNGDDSDYDSRSSADQALANHIAFYTQDEDQIERIMRSSNLAREKWDRGDDYLKKYPIAEALSTLTEVYSAKEEIDLRDFMKKETKDDVAKIITNKAGQTRIDKKQKDMTLEDYRVILEELGYSFALNLLDDSIEVNGEPITDVYQSVIRSKMDDIGVSSHRKTEDKISTIAFNNRYHPIKRYLEKTKWDGANHIEKLTSHFVDTQGLFPKYFKKWLVGAVAKIYERAENKTFILNGPQRIGKSYFAGWLGRAVEDGKFFFEGEMDANDKDTQIRMTNRWIWEIAELSGVVGNTSKGNIKTLLTQNDISVRKAYGRNDLRKKAITSFIGTVNDASGFLNDPTGSYRFMVCTIEKIDHSYSKTMDPNQVWAQAYHLYKTGFDWRFSTEELAELERNNQAYKVADSLEDFVDYYFEFDSESTMHATELRDAIYDRGWKGTESSLAKKLGWMLKRRGVEVVRRNIGRVYVGIKVRQFGFGVGMASREKLRISA